MCGTRSGDGFFSRRDHYPVCLWGEEGGGVLRASLGTELGPKALIPSWPVPGIPPVCGLSVRPRPPALGCFGSSVPARRPPCPLLLESGWPLGSGRPFSAFAVVGCGASFLGSGRMGSRKRGEAGCFLRKLSCGWGVGPWPWGGSPMGRVERCPLGHSPVRPLSGIWAWEIGPLSCDRAVSLSIQAARLCPLPSLVAWQGFAQVTRL